MGLIKEVFTDLKIALVVGGRGAITGNNKAVNGGKSRKSNGGDGGEAEHGYGGMLQEFALIL